MSLFSIVVQLPLAITVSAVRIPTPSALEVIFVSGSLQALISGTFQINVKDDLGNTLGSLSWSSSGSQKSSIARLPIPDGGELVFDVASVGIGAVGCYVTVWAVAA